MKLAEGVNLHVISETKFKTIRVMVRFRAPLRESLVAKRTLISNLMEAGNQDYPTAKALHTFLASLYGASFGTSLLNKGAQHFLSVNLSVVNPKLVGEDTFSQAVDFLQKVIFRPLWESRSFEIEKTNLLHYLASLQDDNDYLAGKRLRELFYGTFTPSEGTIELTTVESLDTVRGYYDDMLKTDAIDIFVLGAITRKQAVSAFEQWNLSDRESLLPVFCQLADRALVTLTEPKEAYQSIVAMGWRLPVQYGDADYLALQVMNGLFGAMPHSKLFSIAREREALAYEIGSSFDSFSGLFNVMAGVDTENLEKASHLVQELLEEVVAGDFSEKVLVDTKKMLRNSYFMAQDSMSNLLEQSFTQALLPKKYLDEAAWLAALEAVTREDIAKVAQKLTLQVNYYLKGSAPAFEEPEHND